MLVNQSGSCLHQEIVVQSWSLLRDSSICAAVVQLNWTKCNLVVVESDARPRKFRSMNLSQRNASGFAMERKSMHIVMEVSVVWVQALLVRPVLKAALGMISHSATS